MGNGVNLLSLSAVGFLNGLFPVYFRACQFLSAPMRVIRTLSGTQQWHVSHLQESMKSSVTCMTPMAS